MLNVHSFCRLAISSAICAVAWAALPAHAQLTLSITPESVSAFGGDRLTFTALLTNTGSQAVILTGAGGQFNNAGLTWDDAAFLNGLPVQLNANGFYSASLFADVLRGTAPSVVTGTYAVQGEQGSNLLEGSDFVTVTVSAAPTFTVPEPASGGFVLGATGVFALCTWHTTTKRRKRKTLFGRLA